MTFDERPMDQDWKPRFMVIGAVKGATTWVAAQLRAQPNLFLPMAEPHFFSSEYHRGEAWYRSLFDAAPPGAFIGEKSADYLAHQLAPRRAHALLPRASLVVQLRDPVARAYSDYCMLFRRGMVDGRIEEHLGPNGAHRRFREDGLYYRHLMRWMEYYDPGQILVLLYEDVAQDPELAFARVSRHIGLPGNPVLVAAEKRHNDSQAPMLPLPVRKAMAPLKESFAPLRNKGWFRKLHGTLARPVQYPPLPQDVRAGLQDYYADDIAELGQFLNRDLEHWRRPTERRVA